MTETEWLAERFERRRPRLRAVAYRMLGSLAEADDAVQDAWLRVSRADAAEVENLDGWLTTIVARVCLNLLRSRNRRREDSLDVSLEASGGHLPDPVVTPDGALRPEDEVLLADSVGLALQVVLDTLTPAERLAFVLHDLFEVPFEEIGPMVGRTPVAARQLASRARRRVKGVEVAPLDDLPSQRRVVDAFFAAAHGGDFDALLALLDPEVILRGDLPGGRSRVLRGAVAVARSARAVPGTVLHPALVNGAAGVFITRRGRPYAVMGFTVSRGRIVEIDVIADPERAARVGGDFLSQRGS
jgi:RNA polymerase sigma factor (sigma-70 family)